MERWYIYIAIFGFETTPGGFRETVLSLEFKKTVEGPFSEAHKFMQELSKGYDCYEILASRSEGYCYDLYGLHGEEKKPVLEQHDLRIIASRNPLELKTI